MGKGHENFVLEDGSIEHGRKKGKGIKKARMKAGWDKKKGIVPDPMPAPEPESEIISEPEIKAETPEAKPNPEPEPEIKQGQKLNPEDEKEIEIVLDLIKTLKKGKLDRLEKKKLTEEEKENFYNFRVNIGVKKGEEFTKRYLDEGSESSAFDWNKLSAEEKETVLKEQEKTNQELRERWENHVKGNAKAEKDKEEKKFSENEKKIIEVYKKDAQEMVEFIRSIDYKGRYGYQEEDVSKLIEIQLKRFWGKLEKQIMEDGLLDEEKAKKAVEKLKTGIK